MSQIDRRITRGVTAAAFGVLAFAATEVLPVGSAPIANASKAEMQTTFNPSKSLGLIGEKALNLSSKVLECLTRISVDAFRSSTQDQDITGRKIVVYNLSNPQGAVTLEVTKDQPFKGTDKGQDTYELNTHNPVTGENFALLRGAALQELCGPVDPNCKKTQIGGYEEAPDGQRRDLPPLTVQCPSEIVCDAWGNVPVQLRLSPPTPTTEPTATPVATRTISVPAQLPQTGN